MADTPAGWFPDPYGRYERRYWDGTTWTAHVATGNEQLDDPLGVVLAIPFAIPKTAIAAQPPGFADVPKVAGGGIAFLDRMGADAKNRPDPESGLALAGIGGFVVADGLYALVADATTSGSARARVIIFSLILLGAGLAARLLLRNEHLRSAAIGAGAAGLAGLMAGILWSNSDHSWALLLYGLVFLAAWALPGYFGRTLFLGIGVLFLIGALGVATAGNNSYQGDVPFTEGRVAGQGPVFLVAAIVLLGLVHLLDRRGYRGTATGFVIPAWVATAIGVGDTLAKIDSSTGASLLVIVAGVVIALVGGYGERRATTWLGAVVAAIGVVSFFASLIEPTSSSKLSTTLLISGALLILAPIVVDLVVTSRRPKPADLGAFAPPSV